MGYSPWGGKELDPTEHACTHTHASSILYIITSDDRLCIIIICIYNIAIIHVNIYSSNICVIHKVCHLIILIYI